MASIGSEWKKWDLHLHTASSYDYRYKNNNYNKESYSPKRRRTAAKVERNSTYYPVLPVACANRMRT